MHTKESTAKLRSELKAAFPGIKFSVRMHRGSSVNIEWVDGPTKKEVSAIADQYEWISRCEVTHEILSGGNSFVFCRREYSPETYQAAVKQALAKNWDMWNHLVFENIIDAEGTGIKNEFDYTVYQGHNYWFSELVSEELKNQSFCMIATEVQPKKIADAPLVQSSETNESITVTENDDRDGVEIRFTTKPSEEVLTELKANGYRWSRFNSCWYAKRSPETLAFAASLECANEPAPTPVEAEVYRKMLAPITSVPLTLPSNYKISSETHRPTFSIEAIPVKASCTPHYLVLSTQTYAPVVFDVRSPQQTLKDKLAALDVDSLSAEQVRTLKGTQPTA
jgi:hypothetical protein